MSGHAPDVRQHTDAVKELLLATIPNLLVYERDDVPGTTTVGRVAGTTPHRYCTVLVEPDAGDVVRSSSGGVTRTPWFITIEHLGMTIREAQGIQQAIHRALQTARITVDGHESSPFQHQTTDAPEPATIGRWLGTSEWTYWL